MGVSTAEQRRRPGGRSAEKRAAVLAATLDLLAEVGPDGLAIGAVAQRAGVHETSIYRRWGTRERLALEAMAELSGNLLPGGSASWQIVSPDGTASAEIRYTLQTDRGALLYVRASGAGHGNTEPGEPLFHATTRIETAAPNLDWLNKGVFITVAGCTAVSMLYETYLLG